MGTNYARGFPADGEGPVRPVSLSAFEIDTFPVTNEDFAAFIVATNYRTEAELFGWSFVFWSHIPKGPLRGAGRRHRRPHTLVVQSSGCNLEPARGSRFRH
jgi:formylglycine-generating enzyme required for sulfatase activity